MLMVWGALIAEWFPHSTMNIGYIGTPLAQILVMAVLYSDAMRGFVQTTLHQCDLMSL